MKVLFYDLETTGLDPAKCAIIQFGGILVDIDIDGNFKPLDAIDLKMKPRAGKWIDTLALEAIGTSLDELMNGDPLQDDSEAYKKLVKFLEKHVDKFNPMDKLKLCGYNNMHFDTDFLRAWFADNGDKFYGSWFWIDQIDVMSEASRYLLQYRPIMKSFSLSSVASVVGVPYEKEDLHNAMYDIKVTLRVFKKIVDSKQMFLPFDPDRAKEIFELQNKIETKKVDDSRNDGSNWIQVI